MRRNLRNRSDDAIGTIFGHGRSINAARAFCRSPLGASFLILVSEIIVVASQPWPCKKLT